MGVSSPAALSPRPNLPGAQPAVPDRAKALSGLSRVTKPPPTAAITNTPIDGGEADMAEQMNDSVRSQFVSGKRLGEGTYAIVYAGHYRDDPRKLVAIKKIKLNADFKDGIAMDAIREIKYLSELSHPNIIKLHAVFSTKDQNLSIVLEHLPLGDLEGLWKNKDITYSGADIKAWSNMLCQAIWFCHANHVLHRDIKGNNLLIAADNTVKLADFGLARSFADPQVRMTSNVITRFYRPPELLLGCYHYGGNVDMWSVGCVIAELALRQFFLPSETDMGQLSEIERVFGTPTEETWPGVTSLRNYIAKPRSQNVPAQPLLWWRNRLPLLGEDGIDLVRGMLTMDPQKRLTAEQALHHRYWTSAPRPTKKENLPNEGGGIKKEGEDLKRKGGETPAGANRVDKVARKLDFGGM
ncbi:TFIIH complex serine/threonine-protein kinase subunit kin28 [Curvularia kusanoi]|uniref:TFIIH complex serine/threonine-protein kinase subunit kin28 n=1 Tax=Curvularia kusanoi TaxID=90978 RepID=A0A9P4W438_CURKU|nr:TFIIH complex serine/threonine-protein kinase subunit kin28 [Curvularia kusanoi]